MEYRSLGKTGLKISAIGLGTVSLGLNYGIEAPHEFGRPDEIDALRLLWEAASAGINFFDTAPNYGESELLLGRALGKRQGCYFATKVSIPKDEKGDLKAGAEIGEAIFRSIETSLRLLRREILDVVQIHNATPEVILQGEMTRALLKAREQGKVRYMGASVYGEESALAVIESGSFEVLQVAYNVLDQQMGQRVFPAAQKRGVGIIVRSALLKGALSPKAQWLPRRLHPLRLAAERTRHVLGGSWQSLPEAAIRFCLSTAAVSTTLIGARTTGELVQGLTAADQGPLSDEILERTPTLSLEDERYTNPAYWPQVS